MPLLMHEVWLKIALYAYEPKPRALSSAKREEGRQNTLATLMRTSVVSHSFRMITHRNRKHLGLGLARRSSRPGCDITPCNLPTLPSFSS